MSPRRVGAFGLDSTEIPDQQGRRLRTTFIDENRFVDPDQALVTFKYSNDIAEFNVEEELKFAQLFKEHPKEFAAIARNMRDRTERECRDHYYKHKHDGRFDLLPLEDREKTWQKLPDFDRRKLETKSMTRKIPNFGNATKPRTTTQLQKIIPIDEEIERLMIATAAKRFEDVHRSLTAMKGGIIDLAARFEIALETHRMKAKAVLKGQEEGPEGDMEINQSLANCRLPKKLFAQVEAIDGITEDSAELGELFRCIISAQHGVRRLQSDKEAIAARLSTSRARRSVLDGVIAEREQQLVVLMDDACALMTTMRELLAEEFAECQDLAALARELSEAAEKLEDGEDSDHDE